MLIAFEGGEATGKSTQARLLAERLGAAAVLTREPGATAAGEVIRSLLLDGAVPVDDRTEALLMAADRAQHVSEVVRPALDAGLDVVTDRYIGSSLAYQGHGRGLELADIAALSAFATGGLDADLVLLLTVPGSVRAARLRARAGGGLDRLERAGDGFHDRVEAGFRALADADPARWVVVDGDGEVDVVHERVWAAVSSHRPIP